MSVSLRHRVLSLVGLGLTFAALGVGPTPCDEQLKRLGTGLRNGYSERADNPDPCCEGEFKELVGGQNAPRLTLTEYSYGPRVDILDATTRWIVGWTSVGREVFIRGRHRELNARYQVDAMKTDEATLKPGAEAKFTWSGAKASTLGFAADDMLFCAWVYKSGATDEAVLERVPADVPVYLPVRLSGSGANGQTPTSANASDHKAKQEPVTCRINLVANKSLSGVDVRVVCLSKGDQAKPIEVAKDISLGTKAKMIRFPRPDCSSGYARLDVTFTQGGRRQALESIYLRLPPTVAAPNAKESK